MPRLRDSIDQSEESAEAKCLIFSRPGRDGPENGVVGGLGGKATVSIGEIEEEIGGTGTAQLATAE